MQSELSLQYEVAGLLRKNLAPPALFTAFPAGGGGEMRGKILSSMGLVSGMPDIWIMWGGPSPSAPMLNTRWAGFGLYLIELKTIKGRLSETQKEIHAAIRLTLPGAQLEVARTLDEAKALFERWGLPKREMSKSEERMLGLAPHSGRGRPFDDPVMA